MKTHRNVMRLLEEARQEQRLAFSRSSADQAALRRRAAAGELSRVYSGKPSLYAATSYWSELTPPQRTMHIARSLAKAHNNWVFGGLVAAVAYGFEHQWRLHDGTVSIAVADHGTHHSSKQLKRVYVPKAKAVAVTHEDTGLTLLPPAWTLIDCAASFGFRYALPFFDSAFAKGVTADDVFAACDRMHIEQATLSRLLRHVNTKSENGGESLARGTMIEERFRSPRVQVPVRDPQTGDEYRTDFVWTLQDGKVVVGEYDGTRKYVDPDMTDNRTIREMVSKERERDEALKRAGAHEVIHFNYDDVITRAPLVVKLLKAGVPRREDE